MRLKDKVAIITGSASGIGRGGAIRFANEGAKVVVADVKDGQGVVDEIKKSGGEAFYQETDVARAKSVEALREAALSRYGQVDIVWSNAGVAVFKPVHETSDEDYDLVMDVNFKGLFHLVRSIVPHMIERHRGVILSTASVDGMIGEVGVAVYSATKGALIGMTRAMAADYAKDGIRVNCICPGWIDTPMGDPYFLNDPAAKALAASYQPVGRLGLPADIAAAAAFLCSDDSSFVTGTAMVVDGGFISTWMETPPPKETAAT
jgi:NAD(P)-dependent dehydrogenase (short-subunit alcohol dehydrogenase family)